MGSLASECNIKHGVEMYITKSFIAVRFIFLILPNKYPIKVIRNTGRTMFPISIIMLVFPL